MGEFLRGETIADVYADSDVVYIMLENGTQITIKGTMVVESATITPVEKV